MRNHEKVEKEAEKLRDKWFNKERPMVPAKKVWRPKPIDSAMALSTPVVPREDDANTTVSSTTSIISSSLEITSESLDMHEEEELVDYEPTPIRESTDINMVFYLPAEFRAEDEEGEVAHVDFGPKNAIFEKPKEPVTHLRPLFLKGHINGAPVARMLVDGGAVVNLMPYSVFKKLSLNEAELIKTNMVLNGFEGKERTEAKGVIYVELTVGSKTLATAFFVAEVQGNYNVILGRDWVHANQCVPSTMHQFLIQWVDDEVEVIHADNLAYVALADASVDWHHPHATCLTGRDLSDFDFLSATKEGFVPVSLKPVVVIGSKE